MAEGDDANGIAALGIDQGQDPTLDDGQSNVHQTMFFAATGVVSAFVWALVDEVRVSEVEPMLLQVGLALSLVSDIHNLIVATNKSPCKASGGNTGLADVLNLDRAFKVQLRIRRRIGGDWRGR